MQLHVEFGLKYAWMYILYNFVIMPGSIEVLFLCFLFLIFLDLEQEIKMTLKEKVEKTLESVRPHLQADGGNVELIDVTEDGIVKVKLTGACGSCPMSAMTLQYGVTNAIKQAIPEVKEVQSI
ncbi:hypothetical protein AGMMS49990_03820 [Endomicrobiia bacterium]|nr:hypothetical protein AGMMS49990_03820 [Endomicrobiia bacterium]